MRVIYLHGFASSPAAHKASLFASALAARGVPLEIPDLNQPSFAELTLGRQLALLEQMTADEPPQSVVLIGSSLGGFAAALQTARSDKVAALVLMAPAFDFHRRWAEKLGGFAVEEWRKRGFMLVLHHATGELASIRYRLLEEAAHHAAFPEARVPTLLFHGRADEVVDPAGSRWWADQHPELVTLELVDDDHMLAAAAPHIIERALGFLERWLPSLHA